MINRETAILKARRFSELVWDGEIPVDVDRFAREVNAEIRIDGTMGETEEGNCVQLDSRYFITVNSNQSVERRRFTALHEIGHIVLDLPSRHSAEHVGAFGNMGGRPREEILCDAFASECLFPHDSFKQDVADLNITLDVIKDLARRYRASVMATGFHVAVNSSLPCAFVLIQDGKIRGASVSPTLEALGGRIKRASLPPRGSVAHRLLAKDQRRIQSRDEIVSEVWFGDAVGPGYLCVEEAFLTKRRRQCLSLIRISESLSTVNSEYSWYTDEKEEDDEPLLEELDGNLRFDR